MLTVLALIASAQPGPPQGVTPSPEAAVIEADRKFWEAYNACDVDEMATYWTEELEFYHDKGGLSSGRTELAQETRDGMCKPDGAKLRREAIPGSVHFYELADYGGILVGEHVFYVNQPGHPEYLDGQARFTHVWQLDGQKWRMHRVLSYDHGPPRPTAVPGRVTVPAELLSHYAGPYQSGQGRVTVAAEDNGLKIVAGDLALDLEPISTNSFVFPERGLRFDFAADAFSVWENGTKVDEGKRTK